MKEEDKALSTLPQTTTSGLMVKRWPTHTSVSVATFLRRGTSGKPLGLTTWAAVRLTRNDVKGRKL
jgi:hypothetical protein